MWSLGIDVKLHPAVEANTAWTNLARRKLLLKRLLVPRVRHKIPWVAWGGEVRHRSTMSLEVWPIIEVMHGTFLVNAWQCSLWWLEFPFLFTGTRLVTLQLAMVNLAVGLMMQNNCIRCTCVVFCSSFISGFHPDCWRASRFPVKIWVRWKGGQHFSNPLVQNERLRGGDWVGELK